MGLFQRSSGRPATIAALDVGTSKVCCIIASLDSEQTTLLGLGHQRSAGIKSGVVVDPDAAEHAVRGALAQAERMAGVTLEHLVLAVGCGRLASQSFVARAPIEGPQVTQADMSRILAAGDAFVGRSGRSVLQTLGSDWRLDGVGGIADPSGLAGRELAVDITAITVDKGPLRNLAGAVERGHVEVGHLVAAPLASALGVSTEEERRHGVLVLDMGAGLTSAAVFIDGRLALVDSVPVGGNHVTWDLARELVAPTREAERIKVLYGTLVKAVSNANEVFAYPVSGEEDGGQHQTSKAHVCEIIGPRIDGTVDLVAERLSGHGLDWTQVRRVVLTGGASQLIGLDQAVAVRLERPTRVARPRPIGRMMPSMCSAAFATVLGLVAIGSDPRFAASVPQRSSSEASGRRRGYLDRLGRWIGESF